MFKHGLVVLALSLAAQANAADITLWNFNSATPDANTATGSLLPSVGSGSLLLLGTTQTFASGDASGGSSDSASGDDSALNTSSYPNQGAGNKTEGVQFNVSTLGFQNIMVSYDLRHSNTSSRYEQFQYSLNGTSFIDLALFDGNLGDTWFNNRTVDLSAISGANNNASFAFRVVSAYAPSTSSYAASSPTGAYGASGTWRFDMVTIKGTTVTPVPEPETYAMFLAGLGLLGFASRRKQ